MISLGEFSKFRLKGILNELEATNGFEYYGELWDAEIDGFTQCLFTRGKNPSTKVICLDVFDLDKNVLNKILELLDFNISQIITDNNVQKYESSTDYGFSVDLIIDNVYHINLNYNDDKELTYISIHSFIPKEVQDKFKPKADSKFIENILNKLLEEKNNNPGILNYDLFNKLKLEYFLDYDFINNYPKEIELFYSFREKEKYKSISWIRDAIGFSAFRYLPKELDKLKLISISFDDFEPEKLKYLLEIIGLNFEKGMDLEKLNSLINKTPVSSQKYGDEHFFYNYQIYSNKNEEYYLECYCSVELGLESFDITNLLKLKNFKWW